MSTPLNMRFDATQVAPATEQAVIPTGWYKGRISASEWQESKNKPGNWFVSLKIVLIGEHDGLTLTDRINLVNDNVMATEIGQRTLSAICHATGVMVVEDMAQLYGIPMMVKVALRPAGKGADGRDYGASNEIKGYKVIEEPKVEFGGGAFPTPPAAAAAPAQAAPAPVAAAPVQAAPGPGPVATPAAAARPPFAAPGAPAPAAAAPSPAPAGRAPWAK